VAEEGGGVSVCSRRLQLLLGAGSKPLRRGVLAGRVLRAAWCWWKDTPWLPAAGPARTAGHSGHVQSPAGTAVVPLSLQRPHSRGPLALEPDARCLSLHHLGKGKRMLELPLNC
jgi:hypothetical protein